MSARAQAVRRGDLVAVTSWSDDSNGLGSFNGEFSVLPAEMDDLALGEAILDALRVSVERSVLQVPPLGQARPDTMVPVYRALGARSARAFAKVSRMVNFRKDEHQMLVTPMLPDGRGFYGGMQPFAVAADLPAAELGRLCREQWDRTDLALEDPSPAHT